jgi:hypothetical protein
MLHLYLVVVDVWVSCARLAIAVLAVGWRLGSWLPIVVLEDDRLLVIIALVIIVGLLVLDDGHLVIIIVVLLSLDCVAKPVSNEIARGRR